MRGRLAGAACIVTLAASASAQPQLIVKAAAAHVTVIPERRADIAVVQVAKNRDLPLKIRRTGESVTVDGGLGKRVHGCVRGAGPPAVRVRGLGVTADAALPRLVVYAPLDVKVTAGDGVNGEVGRAASLDLQNRGCGRWTVANVRGRLSLDQIGGGEIRAGESGGADLTAAAGGDIEVGPVAGSLTAVSSGQASIAAASVAGPVTARVAGSGEIAVRAGAAPLLNASVAGSGLIEFGGAAGDVAASVAGPGSIRVALAKGRVQKRIFGAGAISIGR